MKLIWGVLPVFLAGCQSWDDPLNSEARLQQALDELPHVPPVLCPTPNWQALSLADSLDSGLCHHPETRAAYAEIQSRSAAWGANQAEYLPTLSTSYRREYARSTVNISEGHVSQNPGRFLAEMQWTLFDFGERAARREQSVHLLHLAAASYDRKLQDRWANIARHYVRADIAAQKMVVAADYVQVAGQIVDTVSTLRKAGVAIGADVHDAELEHKRATLQLLQSGQEYRSQQAALAESMGYTVGTDMQLEKLDDKYFDRQDMDDIKTLLVQMLENHPAIAEAQAQADAIQASLTAIRHAGSPQVFLYATSTLNHHLRTQGMHYRENDHVVGIGIRWPLFEGYRRHYQQAELSAQHEKALAELDALKSRLSLDVWQAFQQLQTAQAQRAVARSGVESAKENVQTRLGRYRAGVGELRDVLQAQRNLHELRLSEIDAQQAQHEAGLQLLFSAGQVLKQTNL